MKNTPPLPDGMTRKDVMDGIREILAMAMLHEKRRTPSFVRWPDMDAVVEHMDKHGLPPPEL